MALYVSHSHCNARFIVPLLSLVQNWRSYVVYPTATNPSPSQVFASRSRFTAGHCFVKLSLIRDGTICMGFCRGKIILLYQKHCSVNDTVMIMSV